MTCSSHVSKWLHNIKGCLLLACHLVVVVANPHRDEKRTILKEKNHHRIPDSGGNNVCLCCNFLHYVCLHDRDYTVLVPLCPIPYKVNTYTYMYFASFPGSSPACATYCVHATITWGGAWEQGYMYLCRQSIQHCACTIKQSFYGYFKYYSALLIRSHTPGEHCGNV